MQRAGGMTFINSVRSAPDNFKLIVRAASGGWIACSSIHSAQQRTSHMSLDWWRASAERASTWVYGLSKDRQRRLRAARTHRVRRQGLAGAHRQYAGRESLWLDDEKRIFFTTS